MYVNNQYTNEIPVVDKLWFTLPIEIMTKDSGSLNLEKWKAKSK